MVAEGAKEGKCITYGNTALVLTHKVLISKGSAGQLFIKELKLEEHVTVDTLPSNNYN
jgi:hypothetical protein